MYSYLLRFLFFILMLTSCLTAEIVEVMNIGTLPTFLKKEMLLIFDLDNTLIEPVQELGSDQWFFAQMTMYEKGGLSGEAALEQTLREWIAIQQLTQVKPIESSTCEVVKKLQSDGFRVMGLTTRGLELSHRTIGQLRSISIDLSCTAPLKTDVYFTDKNARPEGVLFTKGVLFTGGAHKGEVLLTFLKKINLIPEAILFINDKKSHLREVEIMCEEQNIPFLGLRYGFLDAKVKHLRLDIANIQFEHFGQILSDAQAEELLESNSR